MMDANAPPNQADRRSPPREADDPPLFDRPDRPDSARGPGEVPREADETTLGPWLQSFFQQSPVPPSARPGRDASSPSLFASSAETDDLDDAIDEEWSRPADKRFDITHRPSAGRVAQPPHSPLHPLRRRVRRLLRNRISVGDVARIVAMVVLLLAGDALIVAAALRYVTHTGSTDGAPWQIPLLLAATALVWILGLTVPSLVLIKFIADLPWFRVGLYFSVIWFLAGLALFL